jgi:dTDP-4-amino-4,6-dideoxygalactose transaminase
MAMLRTHGITRDPRRWQEGDGAAWHYEQQLLGFNYRMIDIQAALGVSQLQRLDAYVARRNALARRYDVALEGLPLQLPTVLAGNRSAFHLYVVRLQASVAKKTHRLVFDELRRRGVGVNLHYTPVHLQPYYRGLGFLPGQYPEAERYGREAITLPLYPNLTDAMQDEVVAALQQTLE